MWIVMDVWEHIEEQNLKKDAQKNFRSKVIEDKTHVSY